MSIAFAFVLFGYAIFAIIFYNKQNGVVLQALSVILIVIFLYFFISFVRKVTFTTLDNFYIVLRKQTAGKLADLYLQQNSLPSHEVPLLWTKDDQLEFSKFISC